MHSIVCIKSVVRSAPGGTAGRTLQNSELNPFDRPALEAALQLKEAHGGSVTALSMGPPVAAAALCEARALGVDRAVLICDAALAGSDTLVTAQVLSAAIQRLAPFDLVLFGVRTADSDTGQVGPQTAMCLDLPFVSGVRAIALEETTDDWRVERVMDDWEESFRLRAPAALTIHARAYAPRHVSLAGIAEVYDRPAVQQWTIADLGLEADQVGLAGSPTRVDALQRVKHGRACRMLGGQPGEQVEALLEILNNMGVMGS